MRSIYKISHAHLSQAQKLLYFCKIETQYLTYKASVLFFTSFTFSLLWQKQKFMVKAMPIIYLLPGFCLSNFVLVGKKLKGGKKFNAFYGVFIAKIKESCDSFIKQKISKKFV